MGRVILILMGAAMALCAAPVAYAQNASSSYEDEAMAYIEEGKQAEAEGDYASACSLYGQAWGKFDWVHDALIEESRTSVERDAYGNVTNATLQSNLQIASENGSKAYDLKVAACANAKAAEPAPLTGGLKQATDLIDLALQQNEAGNLPAACLSLQQSATVFQQLKFTYIANSQPAQNIELMSDNVRITGSELPAKMGCPAFAPETTAYYADQQFHDLIDSGTESFLAAVDASKSNDSEEACRLYTLAAADFEQAAAWSAEQKISTGHEVLIESVIDENTAAMIGNAAKSKVNAEKACASTG